MTATKPTILVPNKSRQRSYFGYTAAAAFGAVGVGLFLAHSAELSGQLHSLAITLTICLLASLVGAIAAALPRSWPERVKAMPYAASALFGLLAGSFVVTDGAGAGFLVVGGLRLLHAAWLGFCSALLLRAVVRDSWLAAAASMLLCGAAFSFGLWSDEFLMSGQISADLVGRIGITESPALRLLEGGLGIEPFGGALYMEQGYLLKDYSPQLFYRGFEYSWLLGLGFVAMSLAIDWASARLAKFWRGLRLRRVGLSEAGA